VDRPTITKIIARVIELYPEALNIPDTEFRRLFDEVATNDFGVVNPGATWKHWSVERTRKRIKANLRSSTSTAVRKTSARDSFFRTCQQCRKGFELVKDMPGLFDFGMASTIEKVQAVHQKLIDQRDNLKETARKYRDIAALYESETLHNPEKMKEATDAADRIEKESLPHLEMQITESEELASNINKQLASLSEHVRPASFVYLMALLDSFIADTLRYFYRKHPRQMQRKSKATDSTKREQVEQKKLSYETIFASDSLDDLIDNIIDREVRVVTGENIMVQFEAVTACGVVLGSVDVVEAMEITATRNIYVHNRGYINAEYLTVSEVYWKPKGGCPFKLGEFRKLERAYLNSAAEMGLELISRVETAV
jgi:hypothetical protein